MSFSIDRTFTALGLKGSWTPLAAAVHGPIYGWQWRKYRRHFTAGDTPVRKDRSNGADMDALIKSLRPGRAADLKPSEAKPADVRPAELDPSEFLAAAVRADQPRPSRSEAEVAVQTLLSYIVENPGR